MTELKDDAYIVIQGWMRTKLGLCGVKLLVYAAVYGFSQDGVNEYTASEGWLSEFLGITQRCLQMKMKELVDEGLVVKIKRNKKLGSTNGYRAVRPETGGSEKFSSPQEEGGAKNFRPPYEKFSPPVRKIFAPYINNTENKESKKEEKEINLNDSACAQGETYSELRKVVISELTNDELHAWYQKWRFLVPETDQDYEDMEEMLWRLDHEIKIRGLPEDFGNEETVEVKDEPKQETSKKKWLRSYADIFNSYGFSKKVIEKLWDFIRHCWAGGQFVTNARLELLCERLLDYDWGCKTEAETSRVQVEVIEQAIRGGYYDFKPKIIKFGGG